MPETNHRKIGTEKENMAAQFLTQNDVRIIAHSFRCRIGEIDLIGFDGHTLVFFEVKYRSSAKCGTPEEAVTPSKQRTICRVSDFFRMRYRVSMDTPVRFDIIAVKKEGIRWLRNAFPYQC